MVIKRASQLILSTKFRLFEKALLIAGILFGLSAISGCELKKDFTLELEKEFTVNETATSYTSVDDINAAKASSDFEKYQNDLESVEIQSATYTVTYFHGPSTQKVNLIYLKVGDPVGTTPVEFSSLSDVYLINVAAKEQTLPINNSGAKKFEELIRNAPHTARLYFSGQANEGPLNFRVKFKFKVKVTYKKSVI